MLPLVGCGKSQLAVTLHQKPNLDGLKGSARNSSVERDHNSRLSLRIANLSIHLIGKCCVLHESWRLSPCTITRAHLPMVSLLTMYILRTHLLDNPNVVFYYKGTAKEHGVPFALNTIIAFEPIDAMIFNLQMAMELCKRLNVDKHSLADAGYSEFEIIEINY